MAQASRESRHKELEIQEMTSCGTYLHRISIQALEMKLTRLRLKPDQMCSLGVDDGPGRIGLKWIASPHKLGWESKAMHLGYERQPGQAAWLQHAEGRG